jgi:hypothetical protein
MIMVVEVGTQFGKSFTMRHFQAAQEIVSIRLVPGAGLRPATKGP